MTLTRRQAVELMERHGLHPSKALGQHFVVDPNTVRRIAHLAGIGPGDRVVEIGAGLGSLTLALAETGASVLAVELDRHLLPVLHEVVEPQGVTVVGGDARTLDWDTQLGTGPWVLVANLPYNMAAPIVADLLDGVPAIARMLVMVQREVAERLAAEPGDPAYGALSVKVRYWATARIVGRVPPTVFVPPPRVESALLMIERLAVPAVDPARVGHERLFTVVRAGFGQRRKMLRRSLAGLVAPEAFTAAGVRPEARAEELSVQDWGRLAAAPLPVECRARAKLTLSLRVVGVRSDGYHLIDAEMVTVDLHDTLVISPGDGLEVDAPAGWEVPDSPDNLVSRALAVVGRTAHVRLVKRIPPGGGLGGGSADAAAVLRWAGCEDLAVAASLGADVAFCLRGGRARVTGIGEVLEPLPHVDRTFTLLTPPLAVSTPAVYAAWDRLGGPRSDGPNDLEPAALEVEPRLAEWRDRLAAATGRQPVLAGSGATWFVEGAFPGEGRIVTRTAR